MQTPDLTRRGSQALGPVAIVAPLLIGIAVLLPFGACSSLPSSGPTASQIEQGQSDANALGFSIVDITGGPSATPLNDTSNATSSLALLPASGTADTVGPGDVLQVTVFEIGTSLFSMRGGGVALASTDDGGGSAPTALGQTLPPLQVDQGGAVTLPYIGRMAVAGQTSTEIQNAITTKLHGKSQTPQVSVVVREKVWSTVMVTGEAKKPGRVPLSLRSERVLDAIAKAGGAGYPAQDVLVRITRRGRSAVVWLDRLAAASVDNILLVPQDQIELVHQPRTYTVFGAANKVSEVPFLSPRVSLAEAIARAGGPSDQQADPSAVFVFRFTKTSADGTPLPDAKPIAYRLDLTKPESYFLAQTFRMNPRDVVYIANAASNQPAKILQMINLIFSPVYSAKVLAQ